MEYTTLMDRAIELYLEERFQEAYALLVDSDPESWDIPSQIFNFRYAIAARGGMLDQAKTDFLEAVKDREYWYSFEYLMSDDDLVELRKDPEIMHWIEICRERERSAKENPEPALQLYPGEGTAAGLWIALHGNQQNAKIAARSHGAVTEAGWGLAVPQSGQIDCSDAYVWTDAVQGLQQLRDQRMQWGGAEQAVSGFSAGGRLALYGILEGVLHPGLAVLVCPWLPELSDWLQGRPDDVFAGTRWEILVGDEDDECLEGGLELHAALEKRGATVHLHRYPGMGHRIPPDYRHKTALWIKELQESMQ